MLTAAVPALLQHVRRLADATSSDEQLLADFLTLGSNDAFSALISRHGPMVLNTCRRILHDTHAAEDVFQATFLVLADRAGSIRNRSSLAGFLHGVAQRLAVRARQRSMQPLPAAVCDRSESPADSLAWKEMLGILDHELGQLSDRHRAPLVLCYLEGCTQDEAACQLGWSLNTLRRRVAKGRQLLEARLRSRGVSLPAALAGMLAGGSVAVPDSLRASTVTAASAQALGGWTVGAMVKNGVLLVLLLLGTACFGFCAMHAEVVPVGDSVSTSQPSGATSIDPGADPIPASGVVRLGTARYRHGSKIRSISISADGKLAVTASGYGSFDPDLAGRSSPARVFDLTDGRCLYSQPSKPGEYTEAVALSPDGKVLATKDGKFLTFWDAATGKELRKLDYTSAKGGGRSITDWMAFSPDGKLIAATLMGDATALIDVEQAKVLRTLGAGGAASACVFSPEGKRIATGGYDLEEGIYWVRLWDTATGKRLARFPAARFPIGNGTIRALAFSSDGAMLAGGGWGDSRLRLWETATGKEPLAFPKVGEDIASVAFAPDGRTVAAAADRIYLYDPTTGKERCRIERRARGLAFSRDGSVLTGSVSGAIYRWEAASGRQLTPATGLDSGVEQILVSADGRKVFTTDQEGNLYLWDSESGIPPRRIEEGIPRGVVASPDRRFLAWAVRAEYGNSRIRLYDIAKERTITPELRSSAGFKSIGGEACVGAILSDGKSILTLEGGPPTLRLWHIESGKEQRSFQIIPPKSVGTHEMALAAVPVCSARRVALSPDGKTLAIGPDFPEGFRIQGKRMSVRLWDVQTGKPGLELNQPMNLDVPADQPDTDRVERLGMRLPRQMKSMDGRVFSPDGRYLVDWAEHPFGRSQIDHVYVWDMETGRSVANLRAGDRPGAANAAFAPDGRTLATASADGVVRLWETATWTVRAEFRGHRDRITAVAFGPDGRLFTGGLDTVVLGWDVRPTRTDKGTLADAWQALASSEAKVGLTAQGRFLAEPDKAVEWFASRVTPAVRQGPARVKALIAQLDADDFATRTQATSRLKEYWPETESALREVAAKSASLEARRRAERLIREMVMAGTPPDALRSIRAVEVLEWIATKEARARLLELAKGAPDARLTRDAVAAGKRLPRR